jgi:hypothetical protein
VAPRFVGASSWLVPVMSGWVDGQMLTVLSKKKKLVDFFKKE